jgi:NADPH2:quinone reductase
VLNAIVIRDFGDPAVLRFTPVEVGPPGTGELRIRQTAIGVNFHDIYVRTGLYRTLALPGIPGLEACGIIEALGPDVIGFAPGDRIAYVTEAYGGYAETRLLRASLAVRVPDGIDDGVASSLMVKGLTTALLVHRIHKIKLGDYVLVHAAAGGVGRLLSQWARHLGAIVIGTVGSEGKAKIARRHGCHHVILYRDNDVVAAVREITSGYGVDVAYDSVGKDTFLGSLECLARLGHLVNFGQSSGPVAPFPVAQLSAKSNTLTRPMLFHYIAERPALEETAAMVFQAVADSVLTVDAIQQYRLRDAPEAHRDLEARRITGAPVLVP